jgi:3-phenylpropionate/cinnamic acid dioxygenase small subunit
MLTTDDHVEIHELLALHAFVFDENQLDRIDELFTPDAVYDMTAGGMGLFEGIDVIRSAASRMAETGHSPLVHYVTNIRLTSVDDQHATALSKGLLILPDGSIQALTHTDTLRRHHGSWRIASRVITPARPPVAAGH